VKNCRLSIQTVFKYDSCCKLFWQNLNLSMERYSPGPGCIAGSSNSGEQAWLNCSSRRRSWRRWSPPPLHWAELDAARRHAGTYGRKVDLFWLAAHLHGLPLRVDPAAPLVERGRLLPADNGTRLKRQTGLRARRLSQRAGTTIRAQPCLSLPQNTLRTNPI
jgi:hypothetical protein